MHVALLLSIQLTVFSGTALMLVFLMTRPTTAARRMFGVIQYFPLPKENAAKDSKGSRTFKTLIFQALHFLRTRAGLTANEKLKQRFNTAGLREQHYIDVYFAFRYLAPVVVVLAWTFMQNIALVWVSVLIGLTYLAPDWFLSAVIKRRREKIRLGLPDALDLMVVCVDAGLGLDQALLRAGQELAVSHPVIAEEFMQINLEQRAGKPRTEAWRDMANRTQLDIVRNFASMLAQTDRFGTPITRALGTFADGLRKKRSQDAEELAAKTTVKLIFPLVLFIFPSMFIVLLGPAALTISRNLGTLGQ